VNTPTDLVRILLVDDFAPFRRTAALLLAERPELKIIATGSNGEEAVRKAAELSPDLVLLDIGLPVLNGIEAAQQITALTRRPKVLFISENRSPVIAREALACGGDGYLVKTDLGGELVPAIKTIMAGGRFIGRRMAKAIPAETLEADIRIRETPIEDKHWEHSTTGFDQLTD
jgi:DNA-binding NarL/FixJ family response regulator